MASGSSSTSTRRPQGSGRGAVEDRPQCPFCKTKTVVERISMTETNPCRRFYTCSNRDWGNRDCPFFMWKPTSRDDDLEAAVHGLKAGMKEVVDSLSMLTVGQSTAMTTLGGQMRAVLGLGNANLVVVRRMLKVCFAILVMNFVLVARNVWT